MSRNQLAVIGLGNYLLGDEGAGMHAVDLLKEKVDEGLADIVDAGTPGMNLLHQFDERRKVIFIDSGNLGLKPGEFKRFNIDDVVSKKELKGFSLHEFDLIAFLNAAAEMGKTQGIEIVIYGMQVHTVAMTDQLSPVVQKSLESLVSDVYNEILEDKKDA